MKNLKGQESYEGMLEWEAFRVMTKAAGILTVKLKLWLKECQLSECEFEMLDLLYYRGSLQQHVLADKIGVSRSHVSHLVEKLRLRSLVSRRRALRDARYSLVRLTGNGKYRFEQMRIGKRLLMSKMMDVLEPEELKTLGDLSYKLMVENKKWRKMEEVVTAGEFTRASRFP